MGGAGVIYAKKKSGFFQIILLTFFLFFKIYLYNLRFLTKYLFLL